MSNNRVLGRTLAQEELACVTGADATNVLLDSTPETDTSSEQDNPGSGPRSDDPKPPQPMK